MSFFDIFQAKRLKAEVDFENLPKHVGIIMDGNGRWAKRRGLPRKSGHGMGAKTFEIISEFAGDIGLLPRVFSKSRSTWRRPLNKIAASCLILLLITGAGTR